MEFSNILRILSSFFASRNVKAFLVGGVVRDALLGNEPRDVDLVVEGNADLVSQDLATAFCGRLVNLDKSRGITRVILQFDTGSFNIDISSIGDSIADNMRRRDFTINAMALSLDEHLYSVKRSMVIDCYGGLLDLDTKMLRSLSPTVFKDDPVRLIRAPRIAISNDLMISEETATQIRSDVSLLDRIAPERTRDEFLKLMSEPNVRKSLGILDDLNILSRIIPEIDQSRDVVQPKEHYWDVFNHLLETVGMIEMIFDNFSTGDDFVVDCIPGFNEMKDYFDEEITDGHNRKTTLKIGALLHDIAKPITKTVEESGKIRFLGHHSRGAEMSVEILNRMRFSNKGVELIRLMVQHHLRPSQMGPVGEMPSGKAIYRYFRDVGDAAIDTLYLNMADYLAARGPKLEEKEWKEHCGIISWILHEGIKSKAPDNLPKLISGHDIMEECGLDPGPEVGGLLRLVYEAHANGEINTRIQALELVKSNLRTGGSGA